jgi:hypothetical protein
MLCGETVAVFCENSTEHTDTVRTSQETYHFSTTEPSRLMLCGETVAVCCENRTEHTDTVRTSQDTQIRHVNVKGRGAYSYHFALKDSFTTVHSVLGFLNIVTCQA